MQHKREPGKHLQMLAHRWRQEHEEDPHGLTVQSVEIDGPLEETEQDERLVGVNHYRITWMRNSDAVADAGRGK